jgi:hypothetical protein
MTKVKPEKPHNYVSFEELLMQRHWEYPLSELDAANMARVWLRVNQLLAKYPEKLAPPLVSSGYRPGHYNVKAGGAARSTHLTCEAVDIRDPNGKLDAWIDSNPNVLVECNLWREDPKVTATWCHLDIRPRKNRTFKI